MSLATFQSSLKTAIANAPAFAGVTILLELDEDATAEQLAGAEASLESALNRSGIAVVITYPRAFRLDGVRAARGAVHLSLVSQVSLLENPAVNRASPDAAKPDVVPANKKPLALMRAAIVALLAAEFEIPPQPIAAPETDMEGINLYGLLVLGRDDIRG